MNLSEFRSQLQKIEKRLPGRTSWPFLCRGSPLTCRIFIVGANPATQDEMRFWDFWTPGRGFRKTEFLRERGGQSKTRTCIEIFSDAAGRNITLETNIYPYATPRKKNLTPEQKRTDIFEYLLHTIKPRIVLAHGCCAKQFFRERGITLVEDRLKSINLDGLRIKLLPRKHLSFQTSHEEVRKIGQKLARALG